jgi:hypothetical protein
MAQDPYVDPYSQPYPPVLAPAGSPGSGATGSPGAYGGYGSEQGSFPGGGAYTPPPLDAAAGGGPPTGGSLTDPAYVAKLVSYYATQPGANPSLKNDPNYWIGKITSGELGTDLGYITGKFMTPEGKRSIRIISSRSRSRSRSRKDPRWHRFPASPNSRRQPRNRFKAIPRFSRD